MISNEVYWLVGAVAVLGYVAWKWWPKADLNNDGKVDVKDAEVAVKKAVNEALDVNNDGKVDVKDAKEAVAVVTAKATKAATKAATKVKNTKTKAKSKGKK